LGRAVSAPDKTGHERHSDDSDQDEPPFTIGELYEAGIGYRPLEEDFFGFRQARLDAIRDALAKMPKPKPPRKPRKPRVGSVIKQLEKATSKTVTGITVAPDGSRTFTFGQPSVDGGEETNPTNPWDED
jgi:hypothetical protein